MNLWAEFENQHAHNEAVGHKPARRLTEQVILSSLREWLLQDYALPYCRSLAALRIYRRCYWIDGWGVNTRTNNRDAGTGSNPGPETPQAQASSPLLQSLALLSQTLSQASKPISLHGIVLVPGGSKRKASRVEQNSASEGEENAAVASFKDTLVLPEESGIVRGSWLEIAPALLRQIASSPAIFLLNPFGQTIFTYDDLLPLYQRKTAPTELCFLIPHQQTEMRLMSLSRNPAGAAALTVLLHTDRWKAFLSGGEGTAPLLACVMDLFVTSIQQHFLWVQRIAFQLQVRPAVVETAPYTLIFATRSKDSLATMNDAVCLYHRRLALQSHRGLLGEEWFAAQQQERFAEELLQLRQHILLQGKAQRVRRWPDLRQQLLPAYFGQFTLNDYDEVIIALLEQGDVRCEWRRRPVVAESRRVPGNEDTLLWR